MQHFRRELFEIVSVIRQPSPNLLRFGEPELSDDQNKRIFVAVQEFIVKTKRFKIN